MDISEFWRSVVADAAGWSHSEKIKLFVWYLLFHGKHEVVTVAQVRQCFHVLSIDGPKDLNSHFRSLSSKSPRDLIARSGGFVLEARLRQEYDTRLGQRTATIHVHQLLSTLPSKLPIGREREYLEEALVCFKHSAFRAAIVMSWNLAFDRLCTWLVQKHLAAFNASLAIKFPKGNYPPVVRREDFTEWKESHVIEVCKVNTVVPSSITKILEERLKRRNFAAHPSGVVVTQVNAEDFITDIVENVVLKLT